jgi:hypothetical protein
MNSTEITAIIAFTLITLWLARLFMRNPYQELQVFHDLQLQEIRNLTARLQRNINAATSANQLLQRLQ